jgi:hypothetical protein
LYTEDPARASVSRNQDIEHSQGIRVRFKTDRKDDLQVVGERPAGGTSFFETRS